MTIVVAAGDATHWTAVPRLIFEGPHGGTPHEVEHARAYADRLVAKLRGVDDANAAAALKGVAVAVNAADAPALPEGEYYAAGLVGMEVEDDAGRRLGRVADVVPTGGTDLLSVTTPDGAELLIPLARTIVIAIDEPAGRIRVRPPEGLLELATPERRRR